MQRARAFALARDLTARAPRGSMACVFAGGSLSRNEVWAAVIDGELEIYSDVDLYVVVRDHDALAPVRAAAGDVASRAPGIDGVHFLRAPDVGVYTLPDLCAQPVRPGTVDLAVHHLVLDGDPGLPGRLPAPEASRIPAHEALYLVENRLAELAAPGGAGARESRLRTMRALKARLDVHSAHEIVGHSFAPSLDARSRRFASDPPPGMDDAARADVADAYRAAGDPSAWLPGRDETREVARARAGLVRAWCTLAPGVLGKGETTEALLARRCHAGERRKNALEALRLRRAFGIPRGRVLASTPWLSRLSPATALRVDALVRECHAEGVCDARYVRAHERYLDRLTRTFGCVDGPLEMRVHAMHRVIS